MIYFIKLKNNTSYVYCDKQMKIKFNSGDDLFLE